MLRPQVTLWVTQCVLKSADTSHRACSSNVIYDVVTFAFYPQILFLETWASMHTCVSQRLWMITFFQTLNDKSACSEIVGNGFFLNFQISSLFSTNLSSNAINVNYVFLICKQLEKTMFMLLIVWKYHINFLISKKVFRWFILNNTDFAHATHI